MRSPPDREGEQEPGDHPIGAYFETHIEQGPVLEDNDKTVGVVSGVLGIRWFDCTVTGMEAHAGPKPMALRKDAMLAVTRMKAFADQVAKEHGVQVHIEMVSSYPAQAFHADCVEAVGRAAEKLGYSHMPAVPGAGHDAVYMAKLAPSGMIFIPCKDGISHNEIEDAKPEHITAGCNVLLHAMLQRAGVARP